MDTLLYKILLLFVGLGFLFLQSREFNSSKIQLIIHPSHYWKNFRGWLGKFLSDSPFSMPLLQIEWEKLANFSEQESAQVAQDLAQKQQQLVVIFPVFTQSFSNTLTTWQQLKKLPIQYLEINADYSGTTMPEWTQAEKTQFYQDFQHFLSILSNELPSINRFAWGAYPNPQNPTEVFWNMILVQFQRHWQGYVVVLKNPTLPQFQALQRTQFPIAIHLQSKPKDMNQWLDDFIFLLQSIQHLPLAYCSLQVAEDEIYTPEHLLLRLVWRDFRWQSVSLHTAKGGAIPHLHAWYWQTGWDMGLVLINTDTHMHKINTSHIFPSFFYQELYYQDPSVKDFKVINQLSENSYKVTLPAQSIAFLSSVPLPFLGANAWIEHFKAIQKDTNTLILQYHLLQDTSQLSLRLFDWAGNELYQWHRNALKAGFYQMHYQATTLPEGIYRCSIAAGNKSFLYSFEFFGSKT